MKKNILFIIFLLVWNILPAQDFPFASPGNLKEQWPAGVIEQTLALSGADYLEHEEMMVIFYSNLARVNGPLFLETILEPYLENSNMDNTRYVRSLKKDLKDTKDLIPLKPDKVLYDIANNYALKAGKKGWTGHKNFRERYQPALEEFSSVAENCDYGYQEGLNIVIHLLIDEGISSLGHRKNILNKSFTGVGVAIQPHKTYRHNCVMSFGGKYITN
jgi:uncharacterized protein YkwD